MFLGTARGFGKQVFVTLFPVFDLPLRVIPADAVAFLDFADQLIAFAGDDVQVVVGELAPLLLDLALDLFLVSFNAVPVHVCSFLKVPPAV